tara:strand:+ start:1487 stop:2077 length:591 start_codon:yes stop_codon:yes gene_type:complete
MKRELYFATPVYIKDVGTPEYNQYLEEKIISWSKQDKGLIKTNVNGWHSTTDMHEKPEYKHLVEELYIAQEEIYKDECLDNSPHLGNMWCNINYKGGFNKAHIHPNSLWSGVYYVKTPKNCGTLKIEDPKSSSLMVRPRKTTQQEPQYLWTEVHFEAQAGRLIMFPSWLNHMVEINQSEEPRISISFNFLQQGMFI